MLKEANFREGLIKNFSNREMSVLCLICPTFYDAMSVVLLLLIKQYHIVTTQSNLSQSNLSENKAEVTFRNTKIFPPTDYQRKTCVFNPL